MPEFRKTLLGLSVAAVASLIAAGLFEREIQAFDERLPALIQFLVAPLLCAVIVVQLARGYLRNLRASENRLKTLVGCAPCPIVTLSPLGIVETWNSAAEKVFGWSEEEVRGALMPTVPPDSVEEFLALVARIVTDGITVRREVVRRRKDGGRIDLSVALVRLVGDPREPAGVLVVMEDISERKAAERRIAELRRQQQAMVDNVPDLLWMKDRDSRFVRVNAAFRRASGRDDLDFVGLTDLDIWPTDLAEAYRANDRLVIETRQTHRTEEQLHDARRGRIWIETIKMPLLNPDGDVIGTTGIARDITDRKITEQERRNFEEQVARLGADIALAEERERRRIAQELHEQVGQTLALGKMKVCELRRQCTEAQAPLADGIRDAIDRSILDIRSLTFQLSPPLLFEVGLEAAVEDLAERFEKQYGLRIVIDADRRPPQDVPENVRVTVFRAVRELLVNAVRHAAAEEVRITLLHETDRLVVEVKDDGVGSMSLSRIPATPGGGVGLFTIRERVGHLGGALAVSTKPGAGFAVSIAVPLPHADVPGDAP